MIEVGATMARRTVLARCFAAYALLAYLALGATAWMATPVRAMEVAAVDDATWNGWASEWRRWERIAQRNEWEVTPLAMRPPASDARIDAMERAAGVPVPTQLRELMASRP